MGVYVQDQLKKVGIKVDFQAIDFGTLVAAGAWPDDRHVHHRLDWSGSDPNDDAFWKTSN